MIYLCSSFFFLQMHLYFILRTYCRSALSKMFLLPYVNHQFVFNFAAHSGNRLDTMSPDDTEERSRSQCQSAPPTIDNTSLEGFSSIETLLMNIQGLLKVAAENARHQERKTGMEKG